MLEFNEDTAPIYTGKYVTRSQSQYKVHVPSLGTKVCSVNTLLTHKPVALSSSGLHAPATSFPDLPALDWLHLCSPLPTKALLSPLPSARLSFYVSSPAPSPVFSPRSSGLFLLVSVLFSWSVLSYWSLCCSRFPQ